MSGEQEYWERFCAARAEERRQRRHDALRDQFAGLAMLAEVNSAGSSPAAADALASAAAAAGMSIEQRIAFNAYNLADAMLAQRVLPPGEA